MFRNIFQLPVSEGSREAESDKSRGANMWVAARLLRFQQLVPDAEEEDGAIGLYGMADAG